MTTVSSKGSNSNITVAQSTNRSHSRNQNNLNNVSNNLVTMNKTLLKYCNKEGGLDTGESGSYSLKMIIMQIKQKCEKLIQIENILHIKQLKLRNVLLKLGYDNPDDFIDEQELMNKYNSEQINQLMQENEHIQTQNLQLNEESKTTIQELQDKITELETQNFQLQTKFQSQLQSLTTRESQILLQEQKLQKQLSRAKENQNKKQEQMRQLEGQFQLNQKIYDEYIGQINSKESEMKLRDDKIRQIEVDMKNRMQIVEQKERDLQVLRQQIISADKSEEFQNQHDQLDQKLTKLAKQDLELTHRFTQLEQAQKLHNQRETRIQEQERQIKAQKNQLFKSYDILTEKIYDFERECDKLRNKKRQFLIQQQKFNLTISQKYEELEKQKLGVIESEYKSKQMIKQQQQLSQPETLIPIKNKQKIIEHYQSILSQLTSCTDRIDQTNQIFTNNKHLIQTKLQSQRDLDIHKIDEALDFAFSLGHQKLLKHSLISNNGAQQSPLKNFDSNLQSDDKWLASHASFQQQIINNSQVKLFQGLLENSKHSEDQINGNSFLNEIGDISKVQSEQDNTMIDELNQALIIPAQDLEVTGFSIMKDQLTSKSNYPHNDSNFDDAGYKGVTSNEQQFNNIQSNLNLLDGLISNTSSQNNLNFKGDGNAQIFQYQQKNNQDYQGIFEQFKEELNQEINFQQKDDKSRNDKLQDLDSEMLETPLTVVPLNEHRNQLQFDKDQDFMLSNSNYQDYQDEQYTEDNVMQFNNLRDESHEQNINESSFGMLLMKNTNQNDSSYNSHKNQVIMSHITSMNQSDQLNEYEQAITQGQKLLLNQVNQSYNDASQKVNIGKQHQKQSSIGRGNQKQVILNINDSRLQSEQNNSSQKKNRLAKFLNDQ
eukprot:403367553